VYNVCWPDCGKNLVPVSVKALIGEMILAPVSHSIFSSPSYWWVGIYITEHLLGPHKHLLLVKDKAQHTSQCGINVLKLWTKQRVYTKQNK
jgi:hypothetical protein